MPPLSQLTEVYLSHLADIERFFASYIEILMTKIDETQNSHKPEDSFRLCNHAIQLVRHLREWTTNQLGWHAALLEPKADPFFPRNFIPRLVPVLHEDFHPKVKIPLATYLQRYNEKHNFPFDALLFSAFNDDLVTVGIGQTQEDIHYLILPNQVDFLNAIIERLSGKISYVDQARLAVEKSQSSQTTDMGGQY